eukprot:30172-Eustigmatos_ZCMA.PRE.1
MATSVSWRRYLCLNAGGEDDGALHGVPTKVMALIHDQPQPQNTQQLAVETKNRPHAPSRTVVRVKHKSFNLNGTHA